MTQPGEGFSISLGGKTIKASGRDAVMLLLIVLVIAAGGFILYRQHEDFSIQHQILIDGQRTLADQYDAAIYVQAAPAEERARLFSAMKVPSRIHQLTTGDVGHR